MLAHCGTLLLVYITFNDRRLHVIIFNLFFRQSIYWQILFIFITHTQL